MDQATFTFPDAWDGDKIEHAFIVHNDGDRPLEILSVQPTCGCTLAKQHDKSIAPGGQGRIEAALDTTGRSGDLTKQINVTTNDAANPRAVLTFVGKVHQRISIQVTIPTGLEVSAAKPAYIVLSTDLKDKPTILIEIRPAIPLTGTQPAAR